MRKIEKGKECAELSQWKKKHPQGKYSDLKGSEGESTKVRRAIRQSLLDEQCGLCAYCCQKLGSINDCHNEHILPQDSHPNQTLNHGNLLASCNTKKQCGDAHGAQSLPLSPLMAECETELRFKISGRVEGTSQRAQETIEVLKLGATETQNKALIAKRKALCDTLILSQGYGNVGELQLEDRAILHLLIDELRQPNAGKLEAFAPILVNILQQYLSPESR